MSRLGVAVLLLNITGGDAKCSSMVAKGFVHSTSASGKFDSYCLGSQFGGPAYFRIRNVFDDKSIAGEAANNPLSNTVFYFANLGVNIQSEILPEDAGVFACREVMSKQADKLSECLREGASFGLSVSEPDGKVSPLLSEIARDDCLIGNFCDMTHDKVQNTFFAEPNSKVIDGKNGEYTVRF